MGGKPFSKLARNTCRGPVNGVVLGLWERCPLSNIAYKSKTSNLLLKVW
jgi:hypothetical protein